MGSERLNLCAAFPRFADILKQKTKHFSKRAYCLLEILSQTRFNVFNKLFIFFLRNLIFETTETNDFHYNFDHFFRWIECSAVLRQWFCNFFNPYISDGSTNGRQTVDFVVGKCMAGALAYLNGLKKAYLCDTFRKKIVFDYTHHVPSSGIPSSRQRKCWPWSQSFDCMHCRTLELYLK